jgi:hypothetical protein
VNGRVQILRLLALGACLIAAGCGSEEGEPIPAEQAQQLEDRLAEVERRVANGSAGACADILRDTEPAVGDILASVPGDVDPDVRNAVTRSFDRLFELTSEQCVEETQTDTTTTETQTETTTTETTETDTLPTDTLPTETTPTDTTPTDTTETGVETSPGGGEGGDGNGGGFGAPGGEE